MIGGTPCLHPSQIAAVNAAHAPAAADVEQARRLLDGAERAGGGSGRAVRVDGEMIDAPRLTAARAVLDRATAFAGNGGDA